MAENVEEKVEDFLFQLGFTEEDIDEFYEEDADIVTENGREYIGPDWLYAKVIQEDSHVDLGENDELIESYWEKGWISDYAFFRRTNFDSFENRYRKVFPTRYKLWDFKFTKSLRRILNKNRDLKTAIRPLRVTPVKSDLYDTYHFLRHGELPEKSLQQSYQYIKYYPSELMELCVFKEKKLIACSIFEVGTFAVYSNMAFWDLAEKSRGLGTLTILLEIQYALHREMQYYYLGYFNPHNPNYHYKTRFSGLELYDWDNDCWLDFRLPQVKELLKQRLPRRKDG
jgi:arginyl-tRNA--protein-N-Asp/Glu arginylyltransferase